jgi:thymidine phosphorylase
MIFADLIRKKRDGKEPSREEVQFAISGYTRNEFPNYPMSAFLMASLLRGMSPAETTAYSIGANPPARARIQKVIRGKSV